MSVKIRLAKRGRKKLPIFDIVVADSRSPRDGKFIEKLGSYNPQTHPATIVLNEEKAFDWIMKGAQPTDTTKTILSDKGILLKKHLQIGVLKGAITQETADKKLNDWKNQKQAASEKKLTDLANAKSAAKKTKLAAEAQVNQKRAEAIKVKKSAATFVEPTAQETPAAEAPAEEAKAE
ncbi:MAG TPA: 30S ribosomal protein S16 [Cytophagaceae bacterium]|nr:30S ribosomal protein S16 [Cytophagaceae bacterium]